MALKRSATKTSKRAPSMERTDSKRRENSRAVGVVGACRRCLATHATEARAATRRVPPKRILPPRINPTSPRDTRTSNARHAMTPPYRLASGSLFPDPLIRPACPDPPFALARSEPYGEITQPQRNSIAQTPRTAQGRRSPSGHKKRAGGVQAPPDSRRTGLKTDRPAKFRVYYLRLR